MLEFITVVRNDITGLIRTVESIDSFCSSYKEGDIPITHLIVDGDSSDGGREFAFDLALSRKVITTVISEPDDGIYDAMNKGVLNSTANTIVFLNAGDVLDDALDLPSLVEDSNELSSSRAPEIIAYSAKILFTSKVFNIPSRNVSEDMPRLPTVHQSIMYRRSDLLSTPYNTSFAICGDYEQFSRMYVAGIKVSLRTMVLAKFYSGGVSSQKPFSLFSESLGISFKYYELSMYKKILLVLKLFRSLIMFGLLERFFK